MKKIVKCNSMKMKIFESSSKYETRLFMDAQKILDNITYHSEYPTSSNDIDTLVDYIRTLEEKHEKDIHKSDRGYR